MQKTPIKYHFYKQVSVITFHSQFSVSTFNFRDFIITYFSSFREPRVKLKKQEKNKRF